MKPNLYDEIFEVLNTCEYVVQVLDEHLKRIRTLPDSAIRSVCSDLCDAVCDINNRIYGAQRVTFSNLDTLLLKPTITNEVEEAVSETVKWIDMIRKTVDYRTALPTDMDEDFFKRIDFLTYGEYECVRGQIIDSIHKQSSEVQKRLSLYYQTYSYFWGTLNTETGEYEVVDDRLSQVRDHRDDFIALYNALEDYRSKYVLISFLDYWATYDPYGTLPDMRETVFKDYYDLDLLTVSDDEVIVDLGAFTGDSAFDYIRTFRRYKAIYCFEISQDNVNAISENLEGCHDINVIQKAAGSKTGIMKMKVRSGVNSDNSIYDQRSGSEYVEIPVTTVDEEISEKVDLIKMDIEGAEYDALKGCEKHIKNDHPKLLISVYHNNRDIWRLFRLIQEMDPEYRFYLRSNGKQWGPAEIVLYAV